MQTRKHRHREGTYAQTRMCILLHIEMVHHTNAKYMYRNAIAHMQMQMYVTSYSYMNTNDFSVWADNTYRHVQLFKDFQDVL